MTTRPDIRDAQCCLHCAHLSEVPGDHSGYCTEGVSRDPAQWPDWADKDESLEFNAVHLCEMVACYEVCDAFKPKE